jgi:hypothetical protein
LAAWQLGSLAAWQLGSLAAWQLGSLAAWQLGSLAAWQLGSLAAWQLGSLAAWPMRMMDRVVTIEWLIERRVLARGSFLNCMIGRKAYDRDSPRSSGENSKMRQSFDRHPQRLVEPQGHAMEQSRFPVTKLTLLSPVWSAPSHVGSFTSLPEQKIL